MDNWLQLPKLPENAIPLQAVIVTQYVDTRDGETYTMVSPRGIENKTTAYGLLVEGIIKVAAQQLDHDKRSPDE